MEALRPGDVAGIRHSLLAALRDVLPQGGLLPDEVWERRHRALLACLWINVALVPIFAGIEGYGWLSPHGFLDSLPVALCAVLANIRSLGRKGRSSLVSFGLLSAAAVFVHLSGGLIEAHFYFFVLIVLLTVYEDWLPFLLAVAFVIFHHGVFGTLEPHAVFNNPAAWDNPWGWALIHACFVALAGAAGIATWRLNETVRREMADAQRDLAALSETDSLTQLANRRKAVGDLDGLLGQETPPDSVLIFFDLDGFKSYNDAFGHPAGDALLTRLGQRLAMAVAGRATAYRLGGDEFCVLGPGRSKVRGALEAAGAAALTEAGTAFSISATHGSVLMPAEAATPEAALRLADQRMYSNKRSSRASAMRQSKDVLLQALAERYPELGAHVGNVTELVEPLAERLGLDETEITPLRHAAELHDVGKVAIPEAILDKPGRLDDDEWEFIRRHTLIGQRIIMAAPALIGVGEIVRSSHERWDGTGYPDGLAGEDIPLGARIIFVCDAYDAMVADRPYRKGMAPTEALAEVHRCAGTQFDERIVDAFAEMLAERIEGFADLAPAGAARRHLAAL